VVVVVLLLRWNQCWPHFLTPLRFLLLEHTPPQTHPCPLSLCSCADWRDEHSTWAPQKQKEYYGKCMAQDCEQSLESGASPPPPAPHLPWRQLASRASGTVGSLVGCQHQGARYVRWGAE